MEGGREGREEKEGGPGKEVRWSGGEAKRIGRRSGWKEYSGTTLNQIPVGPVVLSAAWRCPQIRGT